MLSLHIVTRKDNQCKKRMPECSFKRLALSKTIASETIDRRRRTIEQNERQRMRSEFLRNAHRSQMRYLLR